jgi:hypothetical protein
MDRQLTQPELHLMQNLEMIRGIQRRSVTADDCQQSSTGAGDSRRVYDDQLAPTVLLISGIPPD